MLLICPLDKPTLNQSSGVDDRWTLTCLRLAPDVSNIGAVLKWRAWKREARRKFREGVPLKTYSHKELIKQSERVHGIPPTVADDVNIGSAIEARLEARRVRRDDRAANEPCSPARPSSSLSSCSLVTFPKSARIMGPVVLEKSGAWEDAGRERVLTSPNDDARRPQTAQTRSTRTAVVSAAHASRGRIGPIRPASSPSHRVETAAKEHKLALAQSATASQNEQGGVAGKAPLEEERDESYSARRTKQRVRATSSYCQRLKEGPV